MVESAPERFRKILKQYWDYLANQPGPRGLLSESTVYKYVRSASKFLRTVKSVRQVNPRNIFDYVLSYKNRKGELINLKRFARFLFEVGRLTEQEYEQIKALQIKNDKYRRFEPENEKKWSIPYERWDEVYSLVPRGENAFLFGIWLGFNFGLRAGEIVHLKTKDIYLSNQPEEDSLLFVRPSLDEVGVHLWVPKTQNSVRQLYITEKQKRVIFNYLRNREQIFREYFPGKNHDFVLYNRWGNPVTETNFYKWCQKIKIKFVEYGKEFTRSLRPHVLRYSCAMHLYNTTKDLYAISKFLGHSSIKVTEDYLALSEHQKFNKIKNLMERSRF